MGFDTNLFFFFSSLGAFNGLVLASYFLFFARPRHISNTFLGLFLVMLSIRVGKSVFFYFSTDLQAAYLQFGLTACFFIGPFLFFYVKSIMQPKPKHGGFRLHFLILAFVILVVGFRYPYEYHEALWRSYIVNFIYLQWLIYTILSGIILFPMLRKFWSREKITTDFELWVLNIFLGNTLVLAGYLTAFYTSYIVGALTFSFIAYLLVFLLVFNKKKKTIVFNPSSRQNNSLLKKVEVGALIVQLEGLMQAEQLFRNPHLKSVEVARRLNISVHQLSELMNTHIGKNFSTMINEYRVGHAISMLKTNKKYTLEAIGYESGFNSKSAFYNAFRKITGSSPSRYVSV